MSPPPRDLLPLKPLALEAGTVYDSALLQTRRRLTGCPAARCCLTMMLHDSCFWAGIQASSFGFKELGFQGMLSRGVQLAVWEWLGLGIETGTGTCTGVCLGEQDKLQANRYMGVHRFPPHLNPKTLNRTRRCRVVQLLSARYLTRFQRASLPVRALAHRQSRTICRPRTCA